MAAPGGNHDPADVSNDPFARLVGCSTPARAIRRFGARAAAVDAPVLLLGESGTGKGVLARAIHDASPRASRAYVPVNCAAIPESLFESEFFGHVRGAFTGAQYAHKGLFEQAHGGTLFLDEIGDLPLAAQAKLLTVIEDRQLRRLGGERVEGINVRLIAATGVNLAAAVSARTFRRDLYHRLHVLQFTLPPLRTREGDALILARLFLADYAARYGRPCLELSPHVAALIERAPWFGNVRELAHTIEAAVVACEGRTIRTLPRLDAVPTDRAPTASPRGRPRYSFAGGAEAELAMIHSVIEECSGNKTRAADQLGMSRNTLLNKLRRGYRDACSR